MILGCIPFNVVRVRNHVLNKGNLRMLLQAHMEECSLSYDVCVEAVIQSLVTVSLNLACSSSQVVTSLVQPKP